MESIGSTYSKNTYLNIFSRDWSSFKWRTPCCRKMGQGLDKQGNPAPRRKLTSCCFGICFLQQRQEQTSLTHTFDKYFASLAARASPQGSGAPWCNEDWNYPFIDTAFQMHYHHRKPLSLSFMILFPFQFDMNQNSFQFGGQAEK